MEEAPGVVSEVMRNAVCGGAHRGVRKAGVGFVQPQWRATTVVVVVVAITIMLVVHGR
jgi:hypothetical protein